MTGKGQGVPYPCSSELCSFTMSLRTGPEEMPSEVARRGFQARVCGIVEVGAGGGEKGRHVSGSDSSFSGSQVTILEASDHVGGRVVTFRNKEEGWYYDLGPMRIPKSHR